MIRIFRKEFIIGIVGVAVCLCADAFSDVVVLLMEITPTAILWYGLIKRLYFKHYLMM